MFAAEATSPPGERLTYVDGLRGIAVSIVLIYHVVLVWVGVVSVQTYGIPLRVALEGFESVSLFLVISGFVLTLPFWRRAASGADPVFVASDFMARRALRILPPYYAALVLSIVAASVYPHNWFVISRFRGLDWQNLVGHVLLLHNNTADAVAINGPFWSLGLEWQWYFVCPLVWLACRRSWPATLLGCIALAVLWHVVLHDAGPTGSFLTVLPERLVEFCAGVCSAAVVARGKRLPSSLLTFTILLPLLVLYIPIHVSARTPHAFLLNHTIDLAQNGLKQTLFALVWVSALLFAYQSDRLRRTLSMRPLLWLGGISYSLYLIQMPIILGMAGMWRSSVVRLPVLTMTAIVLACLLGGALLHVATERPVMQPRVRRQMEPLLAHLFGWLDWLYALRVRPTIPSQPSHRPVAD